jgi:hypothetical protein
MKKEDLYARMMHTLTIRAELRAALRDAWKQLMPLHRALIDAASAEYAANVAPVTGPTHLLRLLQEDPFFEWLRPLTSIIVDPTPCRARTSSARTSTRSRRVSSATSATPPPPISARATPLLQRDIDAAVGHANLRKILQRLWPP